MAGGNGADENWRSFTITAQFVPKLCLLFQGVLENYEIQAITLPQVDEGTVTHQQTSIPLPTHSSV
jgi:hypothetical protein